MLNRIKSLWANRLRGNNPIEASRLDDYVKKEYPDYNVTDVKKVSLENYTPLRQGDYKGKLNCSITSITASIYYYTGGKYHIEDIYRYVSIIARVFGYTDRLWGTLSFTIMPVYAIVKYHYKVRQKSGCGFLKNIGYGAGRIISHINSGSPVLLNMFSDGRRCYHNHTVTITGYKIYFSGNEQKLFLLLNDNWSKEERALDYSKLNIISSINY